MDPSSRQQKTKQRQKKWNAFACYDAQYSEPLHFAKQYATKFYFNQRRGQRLIAIGGARLKPPTKITQVSSTSFLVPFVY